MPSSSNNLYPRVGVGVIILKGKDVLLGKRRGPRGSGFYGLPGGYLENQESFENCAKREVFEETGLSELLIRPIYLISGSSGSSQYVDIIFYADYAYGEPTVRETDRVEKWEWCNIYNLPAPLYGPTALTLEHFVSNYYRHRLSNFLLRWLSPKQIKILCIDSINTKK
jgi:8-oxo-dGTP diphosphatase